MRQPRLPPTERGEVPRRLKTSLSATIYRAKVRRERLDDIRKWVAQAH